MKKKTKIITAASAVLGCAVAACGVFAAYKHKAEAFTPSPDEWELTFEDNFDTFDKTKWKVNMHGESNIRRAAYHSSDDDIVFTKDGNLHIRTVWKDGVHGEGWYTSYLESSQSIHKEYESDPNYKGFSQTGGYFEIRCKVPYAKGIWSAFWLMPDNEIAFSENDIQWSGEDGLEIDIMESPNVYQKSKRAQNQNIHVIHADGYDEKLKTIRSDSIHVPHMYDEFHTYSLLWDEDKYTFFIDGKKTWETKHIYENKDMGICKVPEYLLLTTEVAGSIEDGKVYEGKVRNGETGEWENFWCGNPADNDKSKSYDFVVDYVRCYKRK